MHSARPRLDLLRFGDDRIYIHTARYIIWHWNDNVFGSSVSDATPGNLSMNATTTWLYNSDKNYDNLPCPRPVNIGSVL